MTQTTKTRTKPKAKRSRRPAIVSVSPADLYDRTMQAYDAQIDRRQRVETRSLHAAKPYVAAAVKAIEKAVRKAQYEAVIYSTKRRQFDTTDEEIVHSTSGRYKIATYEGNNDDLLSAGIALGLLLWARQQGLKATIKYRWSGPPSRTEIKIIANWGR